MSANIEVKARLHSPQQQRELARLACNAEPTQLVQRDTFFAAQHGRLKLREIEGESAQLIHYFRADAAEVRKSDYVISPVSDVPSMLKLLGREFSIRGVVSKVRRLWISGQTRIHFDSVEKLGEFVELEFVLQADQAASQGHDEVAQWMRRLDIRTSDVVECAYIDLLEPS